jgi:PhnB protein
MSQLREPVLSVMLAVPDTPAAVTWYQRALGATVLWSLGSVAGLEIAGAPFFLGEPAKNGWESPTKLGITSCRVEVFCDDPDAVVARAVECGADGSRDAVRDHPAPWGTHRQGGFIDPFGHIWLVGDRSPLHPFPARTSVTAEAQPPASADPGIVATRVLDAPRDRVFRAFSEPSILARWWGPRGFTNTFQEFDFRTGGAWRFVMYGPDGTEYQMANDFLEVVHPERISLLHLQRGHEFRLTITLADEAGRTRLTWRMEFESPEEAERVRQPVAEANEQNLDKLEAQLATMA